MVVFKLPVMFEVDNWISYIAPVCAVSFSSALSIAYFVKKYICFSMPVKAVFIRLIYVTPIVLLSYLCVLHLHNGFISLAVISLISFIGWIGIEYYILKNTLLRDNIKMICSKIINR